MSTNPQPEALRLADELEFFWGPYSGPEEPHELNAAAELRRLHSMNQELLEALQLFVKYEEAFDAGDDYEAMISYADLQKSSRAAIAKATGETK